MPQTRELKTDKLANPLVQNFLAILENHILWNISLIYKINFDARFIVLSTELI